MSTRGVMSMASVKIHRSSPLGETFSSETCPSENTAQAQAECTDHAAAAVANAHTNFEELGDDVIRSIFVRASEGSVMRFHKMTHFISKRVRALLSGSMHQFLAGTPLLYESFNMYERIGCVGVGMHDHIAQTDSINDSFNIYEGIGCVGFRQMKARALFDASVQERALHQLMYDVQTSMRSLCLRLKPGEPTHKFICILRFSPQLLDACRKVMMECKFEGKDSTLTWLTFTSATPQDLTSRYISFENTELRPSTTKRVIDWTNDADVDHFLQRLRGCNLEQHICEAVSLSCLQQHAVFLHSLLRTDVALQSLISAASAISKQPAEVVPTHTNCVRVNERGLGERCKMETSYVTQRRSADLSDPETVYHDVDIKFYGDLR